MTFLPACYSMNRTCSLLSFFALLLLAGVLVGAAGCKSAENGPEEAGTSSAPDDFRMVFGKGGGFAGLWQGYTIAADGTVGRWEGTGPSEDTQPVGTLTPARRDSLWHQLNTLDFFALENQGAGNMTGFIEVAAQGTTHTVRWPVSLEKGADETPYERIYAYAQALAEAASR